MSSRAEPSRWLGALSGLLAAAVAMGIAQLVAGFTIPDASPVIAVGSVVINHTPLALKDWATSTFGTSDKTVLLLGVFVVVFLYAMVVGILALRRLRAGFAGLTLFAVLGAAAALTRHGASVGYAVPTIVGALAGALALARLVVTARASAASAAERREARAAGTRPITFGPEGGGGQSGVRDGAGGADGPRAADSSVGGEGVPSWVPAPAASPSPAATPSASASASAASARAMRAGPGGTGGYWPLQDGPGGTPARRSFLVTAGVTAAAAVIGEVGGRSLATRKNVSAARSAVRLPRAAVPARALPAGVNLPVPGISPFITPNGSFYRVDTALLIPQVDPSNWQLRIHGMVQREIVLTFDELLKQPLIEDYVTLCCVSNPVGGPYIGNAKWLGASYGDLIRKAGPLAGADQLFCTSVDGFTSGTPLATVLDAGRESLIAVAMNGTVLPTAHGFPVRLVVPGLYGYVSACKWVVDIEVTTFAKAVAYWVPLGWSQQGPVKTESRIDVPGAGSGPVRAGKVPVAGVAWAQHKGIEAVEVRVDRGAWQQATLAAVPGLDTWRQWVYEWDATAGNHLIEARATDKTGYTQTAVSAPVAPNGASGYPSVQVSVS
jgi:DMSO/TMAO reductase YedYZ molybdopterin-dependent catalytic subunit